MTAELYLYSDVRVAPFTGAWIEIIKLVEVVENLHTSHPSRVRGLK